MIEFEEYKSKLSELKPKLEELRAAFLPQSALDELERLHAMAEAPRGRHFSVSKILC